MNVKETDLTQIEAEIKIRNEADGKDHLRTLCIQKAQLGKVKVQLFSDRVNLEWFNNFIPSLSSNELTKEICVLLHFQQYVVVQKEMFLRWDEGVLNSRLSESVYLNAATTVKEDTAIIESEDFYGLLHLLLINKTNNDETKAEKTIDICTRIVATEWLNAGLLKSLTRCE